MIQSSLTPLFLPLPIPVINPIHYIPLSQSTQYTYLNSIQLNSNPQSKSNKSSEKYWRPSASKKYPGQIMKLLAHYLQTKFANDPSSVSKETVLFAQQEFLGKQGEDYKVSSVKQIHKILDLNKSLSESEKFIKLELRQNLEELFRIEIFFAWVNANFNGTYENKEWLLLNSQQIKNRILHNIKMKFNTKVRKIEADDKHKTPEESEVEESSNLKRIKV